MGRQRKENLNSVGTLNPLLSNFAKKVSLNLPQEVREADKIAVAFSGGADSVALLTALYEIFNGKSTELLALHCNFHLRGDESDEDTNYCIEWAYKNRIAINVRHFPAAREDAKKDGISIEMACRELRYDWFKEYSAKGYYIGVGHHIEDNRETILLKLFRGSGLKGLKGIEPYDPERKIFRPMLGISRNEIEDYLRQTGTLWRTDSSNTIADVQRNKLRLHVMPTIRNHFPDSQSGIDTTVSNLRTDYKLLDEYMEKITHDVVRDNDTKIDIKRLKALTSEPQRILFHILQPYGFNYSQCESIIDIAESRGYKKFISGKTEIYADSSEVLIPVAPTSTEDITATSPERLCEKTPGIRMTVYNVSDFDFNLLKSGNPRLAFFDYDLLPAGSDSRPYVWRAIKAGDRIKPFGMGGRTKLISDMLTNLHFSPIDKSMARVLADPENRILWAAPIRQSEFYRITDKTRRIIVLEYNY